MSSPYTSPTLTGYNATAPADDGSNVASNAVQWQKHLDKIGDPLRSYIDEINTNVQSAFTSIYGVTPAESAAMVTPVNFAHPQAKRFLPRYGPVSTLSAANYKNLFASHGLELINVKDVDIDAGTGDATTDTDAINAAADQIGHQGTIILPPTSAGYAIKPEEITFTGPVRLQGAGRFHSQLILTGFTTGQRAFVYDTGTASRITSASMSGLYVTSSNGFGRLVEVDNCVRSDFSDIWCEGFEDFFVGQDCYSNEFYRCETNNLKRYGIRLLGAGNQVNIDKCIFDGTLAGAMGVSVIGGGGSSCEVVNVRGCSFEGFLTTTSHAIVVTPATGLIAATVNVIENYFEAVAGYCVNVQPVDDGGVRTLRVRGNNFFGGHVGHFSSQAGFAASAVVVFGTRGATIEDNTFRDFEDACVSSLGSNYKLRVVHNQRDDGLDDYNLVSGSDSDVRVSGNFQVGGSARNPEIFGSAVVHPLVAITYSASITIDAADGNEFQITANDGNAFTINAPTNLTQGQVITIMIRNTSGGALGTVTWNAIFKLASWTSPATSNSRSISFRYDGTNLVEVTRTTADIPN